MADSKAWIRVVPIRQSCHLDLQLLSQIPPASTVSTAAPGPRPHHLLAGHRSILLPASQSILHPAAGAVSEHKPDPVTPLSQALRSPPSQLKPRVLPVASSILVRTPYLCSLPHSARATASLLFLKLPKDGPVLGCSHLLFPFAWFALPAAARLTLTLTSFRSLLK